MILRGAAFAFLSAAIVFVQVRLDRTLGEYRAQEEVLYVWSGGQVKRLAPGFEGVMADLYWLRTIQYFGGQRAYADQKHFNLLKPLIDIVTALDPRMEIAYRYGAIFLSEKWPVGAGRPEEGIAQLARGAPLVREGWRLRQQEGYFTFLFLGDSRKASKILVEASRMPGAPYWLETLAGQVLIKGGERQLSRQIWRQMLAQSEAGGGMRENAAAHLRYLDALDAADELTRAVENYEHRHGRKPETLDALRVGGHRGPVLDPCRSPFSYDAQTGKVSVSTRSRCWRTDETVTQTGGGQ